MTFETSLRASGQVISLEGAKNLTPGAKRATATIFRDPVSQILQADLDRIAPSDASVLVVGETGTGKELISRYIHAQSRRRSAPFLAINCGAFSESMAEAELFGFEKGAFTGASRTQPGWFEAAQGGTLLLDEIGDLPLILQVKLLRVLQEREVVRVGSRKPIAVDVRVIAATNVDLEAAVRDRRFREDLYFRLNVAPVRLAPLRERPGDIEPLARHFLEVFRIKLNRPDLSFGADAIRRLVQCAWPGNIRQLENTIQNAAILTKRSVIGADDIRLRFTEIARDAPVATLEDAVRLLVERAVAEREEDIFDRILRRAVHTAFEMTGGNQLRAAEAIGLSRNAFRTHLGRIGTIPPRRRTPLRTDTGAPPWGMLRPAAKPVTLNIGVQKYGTSSILKVFGSVQQRLAPLGFNVTWTEFPSGPQLLQALGRNDVAFVATGDAPPIFGQAAGIPLVYVGHDPATPDGEALVVRRGSTIHRTDQLRGKAVALHYGSNVQHFLVRALGAHGLTMSDVRPIHMLPGDALQALTTGCIDAWAIWDPLLSSALVQGDTRVLMNGEGVVSNHQFYLTSRRFAECYPEAVAVLLEETGRVGEYTVHHTAEVARSMSNEIGIEARALEMAFSRLSYGARPLDNRAVQQQQDIANTFHALGILPAAISVREAVWPGPG